MHRAAIILLFVALVAAKLNLPTIFSTDVKGKVSFSGQTATVDGHFASNDEILFSTSITTVAGQKISSNSVIFAKNHTAYTWDKGCQSVHLSDQQFEGTRVVEYVNEHAEPAEGSCSGPSEEGNVFTIKFPAGSSTPFGDFATLCASKDGKSLYWLTLGNATDKIVLENFQDSAPELEHWMLPSVCYDAGKRLNISSEYSYKYIEKNTENGAVTKVTEGSVHRNAEATVLVEKSGESDVVTTWFPKNNTAYHDYHSFCFASNTSSLYNDQLGNTYLNDFSRAGPCESNGRQGHLWTFGSSQLCTCDQDVTPYYYEYKYSNRVDRLDYIQYEPQSDAVAQLSDKCTKVSVSK